MGDLKVGQAIFYVRSRYNPDPSEGRQLVVATVGRRWATLADETGFSGWFPRIDKHTLLADGNCRLSSSRCYLSREDCERDAATIAAKTMRDRAWDKFRKVVSFAFHPPSNSTPDTIKAAAKSLGLDDYDMEGS